MIRARMEIEHYQSSIQLVYQPSRLQNFLQRSEVEKNSNSNSVCLDSGRTFQKKKIMRYLFFISTGADIDQVDQVC